MVSNPATESMDRPFSGKPQLGQSWNDLTENVSIIIYTTILSILLGPISFYYFAATSYVKGSYVSIDDYNSLIFTKKFLIPGLLFNLLLWGSCLLAATIIGVAIPIILLAAAPLFAHYVATTDENFIGLLKKSFKETIKDPGLIIMSLVIALIASIVAFIACCGLGGFVTFPLSLIYYYNMVIYKKFGKAV